MPTPAPFDGQALLADPIADAVIATIRERGYRGATVVEFLERSGLTREDFDRRFSGKQKVTKLVFEAQLERFRDRVARAYDEVEGWPDNLRAAAYETARFVLEYPDVTWFVMVGIFEADDTARARRDNVFTWAASLIEAGRDAAPDPDAVPESASLMAVGAIVQALQRQATGIEPGEVAKNLPSLMYAAVRPYLGEEAAQAELEIELPDDLASR